MRAPNVVAKQPIFRALGRKRSTGLSRTGKLHSVLFWPPGSFTSCRFEEIRYLRVDALPMSRPILEKYGFQQIASTWPAEWPPNQ